MTRHAPTHLPCAVLCALVLLSVGCGEALEPEAPADPDGWQAGQEPAGETTDQSDDPLTATETIVVYRAEVLERVNTKRTEGTTCGDLGQFPAQPDLHREPVLDDLAMDLSLAQANAGDVFHSSSLGLSAYERGVDADYFGEVWGENVSGGDRSPQSVVDGWMTSPSHCSVIMMADVDEIGIGYAFSADAPHGHYWTLMVGQSAELCPIAAPWRDDCPA